jgi:hypothetical protein
VIQQKNTNVLDNGHSSNCAALENVTATNYLFSLAAVLFPEKKAAKM